MSMIKRLIGLGTGVAAIAAAAPVSAQYYSGSRYAQSYGYGQSYGYSQPYARSYGYGQTYGYAQPNGYAMNTGVATQQCTAAVQNRLYNRSSLGGILGTLLGANTRGQVLSITQVNPRGNGTVRVRGLATSGRYASNGYGQYGVGAYGALGYGYSNAADLSFRCDVGPNGAVYDVSINRR
jgi:hypothetical protein